MPVMPAGSCCISEVPEDTASSSITSSVSSSSSLSNISSDSLSSGVATIDGTNTTLTVGGDTVDAIKVAVDGEVIFLDGEQSANTEIAADAVDSAALLAVAIQALQGSDLGNAGATVWMTGQIDNVNHTWVYSQTTGDAGGNFVDLVGVKLTGLSATLTDANDNIGLIA